MKTFLNLLALLSLFGYSATAFSLDISEKLVNGGVKIVEFTSTTTPRVTFYDKKVLTTQIDDTTYRSYIGIPIGASVGTHTYIIHDKNTIGSVHTHTFVITDGAYKRQYITLEGKKKKFVDVSPEHLKRIRGESAQIQKAKRTWSSAVYADNINIPTQGIITGVYGSQRFFNTKPRRPHSGLDIANDTGTPVRAIANGKVILTGDFFFNGNTVIIDHGQGLLSLYVHLDSIAVSSGDILVVGEVLGAIGSTGRSTGPHLHISIYLNEVAVDPLLFLNYNL